MNKKLLTILAGGILVFGGLGAAVAAQVTQESNLTGTIQVPSGTSDLVSLAEVSMQEAVAAAQEALGTTDSPAGVDLEVENGYLVWEVELGGQEVLVDAGSGEVLLTKAEQGEGDDDRDEEDDDEEDEDEDDD